MERFLRSRLPIDHNALGFSISKEKFPTGPELCLIPEFFLCICLRYGPPALGLFTCPAPGVFEKFSPRSPGVSAGVGGARAGPSGNSGSENDGSRIEPLREGPSFIERPKERPPRNEPPVYRPSIVEHLYTGPPRYGPPSGEPLLAGVKERT